MPRNGILYLVRHTELANDGVDSDLSADGLEHAKQLKLKVDTVIVSKMRCAVTTVMESKIWNRYNLLLTSYARERIDSPSTRCPWEADDLVESFELFAARVRRIRDMARYHLKSGSVAIVSHENFLHELQKKLLVRDPQPMAMGEIRVVPTFFSSR